MMQRTTDRCPEKQVSFSFPLRAQPAQCLPSKPSEGRAQGLLADFLPERRPGTLGPTPARQVTGLSQEPPRDKLSPGIGLPARQNITHSVGPSFRLMMQNDRQGFIAIIRNGRLLHQAKEPDLLPM